MGSKCARCDERNATIMTQRPMICIAAAVMRKSGMKRMSAIVTNTLPACHA